MLERCASHCMYYNNNVIDCQCLLEEIAVRKAECRIELTHAYIIDRWRGWVASQRCWSCDQQWSVPFATNNRNINSQGCIRFEDVDGRKQQPITSQSFCCWGYCFPQKIPSMSSIIKSTTCKREVVDSISSTTHLRKVHCSLETISPRSSWSKELCNLLSACCRLHDQGTDKRTFSSSQQYTCWSWTSSKHIMHFDMLLDTYLGHYARSYKSQLNHWKTS